MKKFLIFITCFLLIISITNSKLIAGENKMLKNSVEFGLKVNDTFFSVPSSLKQLLNDGWKISDKEPYFLNPIVGEDYYRIRTNWSLSNDKKRIVKGGRIIRLLEKDGVFLEVTIINQDVSENDKPCKKIEDCTVDSITVFYDEKHPSIKINNKELNSLTPKILVSDYSLDDGWQHVPTNYRNHPEFKTSTEYSIIKNIDNYERSITIYFDLEDKPLKVVVSNGMPLEK